MVKTGKVCVRTYWYPDQYGKNRKSLCQDLLDKDDDGLIAAASPFNDSLSLPLLLRSLSSVTGGGMMDLSLDLSVGLFLLLV